MPLNIAEPGKVYKIWRVGGLEKEKHHLENLGFVPGKSVTVLSRFNGYFVVCVDETRVQVCSSNPILATFTLVYI